MDASVSDICQKPPVSSVNSGSKIGLEKDITNLYDLVILLRMLAIAREATGTPTAAETIVYYGEQLSKAEFPQAYNIYIGIHNRDKERSATVKIKETIIELAKKVNPPTAVLGFNPAASDHAAWFRELTSAKLEALSFKTPANQTILKELIKLAKMLEIARNATGSSSTPDTMTHLGGQLSGQASAVDGGFDVYMAVHGEKNDRSATQKVKLTIKRIWDGLPGAINNLIPGISNPVKDLTEAKVSEALKKICAAPPPPPAPAPAHAPAPKPTPPIAVKPGWRTWLDPRVSVDGGYSTSEPEKPVTGISRPVAGLRVDLGSEDPDVSTAEFRLNKKPVTIHPRAYFQSDAYRGAGGLPMTPPFNAKWGTGARLSRKLSSTPGSLSLDLEYRGARNTGNYPTMDRPSVWENGLAGRLELALKKGPLSKFFIEGSFDRSTWEAWNVYTAQTEHPNFTGDRFVWRAGGEAFITEKLTAGGALTFGQQDLPRYAPALGYAEPEQVPVSLDGQELYARFGDEKRYLRASYAREGLEGFRSTQKLTLGGGMPLGRGQLSANLSFLNHPTHFAPVNSPVGAEAAYRRALYQSSRPWLPNVEAQVAVFYDNLTGLPDNFGGLAGLSFSLSKPAKSPNPSPAPSPAPAPAPASKPAGLSDADKARIQSTDEGIHDFTGTGASLETYNNVLKRAANDIATISNEKAKAAQIKKVKEAIWRLAYLDGRLSEAQQFVNTLLKTQRSVDYQDMKYILALSEADIMMENIKARPAIVAPSEVTLHTAALLNKVLKNHQAIVVFESDENEKTYSALVEVVEKDGRKSLEFKSKGLPKDVYLKVKQDGRIAVIDRDFLSSDDELQTPNQVIQIPKAVLKEIGNPASKPAPKPAPPAAGAIFTPIK